MLDIRHGYRTAKNCVYIVAPTHTECVVGIQKKHI